MELKNYFLLIWRWVWLIILGVVIAAIAAFLISKNTAPVYQSTSRLLIDQAPGAGSGNDYTQILVEERLAQTYVELLKTDPILEETISQLELPMSVPTLKKMISVSAPQETQIIIIQVEDTNKDRAALIANTLGQVFIFENQKRESLRYADPINNWEERLQEIGDQIETIETEINTLNAQGKEITPEESATLSRLETNLNEAQIRYTETFNNLNDLQIKQAKETSNLIQIEEAKPHEIPIRPRTETNVLLAAAVGGMIAVGIIFLIEYLDDTIKTPDQVLEKTNLATLGAIAIIKDHTIGSGLITQNAPRDPISEAYRIIRTNLSFSTVDKELKSYLVTSASPGEGKSTTAANLAVVLAQTGKKVVLIDADLRRPIQHKIFNLPNNMGLTTSILDGRTPVTAHLQQTKISNLGLLTSGPIPPNPSELLNSRRMQDVLKELEDNSDLVIFDTPPVLTVADASIIGPQVNGVLLVINTGRTRQEAFINAVDRLRRTGTHIFGAIFNRVKLDRSSYGYYYYSSYEYNAKSKKRRSRRLSKSSRIPSWITSIIKRS
ncbi:MAG: hypothetical protein CSB13_07030 [Chloroflexi bacterium]|nr:MAG: hypothetical protein CSB13_07030 [Chloroflexota bacterium]